MGREQHECRVSSCKLRETTLPEHLWRPRTPQAVAAAWSPAAGAQFIPCHCSDTGSALQGQGNGREVSSASGAAAGAKSYAANIVQSGAAALPSQTGGTAAAVQQGASPAAGSSAGAGASPGAAGQQVVSMLAQQPGTQAAGASGSSGGSGASSGGGGGGTSLVDRMTNHILGAGAGSGGGTSLTTAGGQGLLMPGRRRLQGRAAGGVGAERTRARQSARRTLQGWRALARGGR